MEPGQQLEREKQKQVDAGYAASARHIAAFGSGSLQLKPGCDAAQTLEDNITGELNKIREAAGKVGRLFRVRESGFKGFRV